MGVWLPDSECVEVVEGVGEWLPDSECVEVLEGVGEWLPDSERVEVLEGVGVRECVGVCVGVTVIDADTQST